MQDLLEENILLRKKIDELEKKIDSEIKDKEEKNKILLQQTKMASLGEMLNNIAHQWRQPLMELSSIFMLIQSKIEFENKISNDELLEFIKKSNTITKYMSNTIEEFRNFFVKDKKKEVFKVSSQLSIALTVINTTLKQNNIKVKIYLHKNPTFYAYKNEFIQVILNILTNAKDAFLKNKIDSKEILININKKNTHCVISIEDNAGGIKSNPIEKIFEPFYSEDKINGTGVGLFMSKLIVEKNLSGNLLVENTQRGAKFTLIIPLEV